MKIMIIIACLVNSGSFTTHKGLLSPRTTCGPDELECEYGCCEFGPNYVCCKDINFCAPTEDECPRYPEITLAMTTIPLQHVIYSILPPLLMALAYILTNIILI